MNKKEMYMAKCYQLIGVPGSGKSTWVKNQVWAKDCVVVSTDEFVEDYAKSIGSTYSEVFDDYMPKAIGLMMNRIRWAEKEGKDIIWDQTSTSVGSRKRKFNSLRDYEHIAVVFKTPEKEELAKRLASRPGKNIPDNVMRDMIKNFVVPTEDEGFKEVWFAQ
jgi:predicted kinase